MDDRLYEAAVTGDVELLHSLLEEDGTLRVLVGEGGKETPLHIAAQFGHVEFVKEILERRPEFACQLNFQDRTPLHLASAEGHTAVVKALLEKDKKACFVRDGDGMIPLHLAAVKGRVEALKELVIAKKVTILIKIDGGEPLLHLCLKHDRIEAIKTLIEIAGDDRDFMSLKDEDPFILHRRTKQREREMDERLYEAAITGNVSSLSSLMSKDPFILDRVLVGEAAKETPLHIAAQYGHVDFVKEILKEKPEFARQLNSQERNPLHLASVEGHIQVVKALLEKDTHACFVRDRDGMIPLHLAAIKGRVEALKELVIVKKVTILIKTDGGEPLLHLCLKHDRFEATKTLIEIAGDDREFMSLKDEDENTLLHLLAAKRQYKIIKLLFPYGENTKELDVNATNVNGSTPLDVLREVSGRCNRIKIGMVFRSVKAKRARELPRKTCSQVQNRSLKPSIDKSGELTYKTQDALMVVAILIATVTFQAALNPPGGVWQEDGPYNSTTQNVTGMHYAGQAVMSDKFPHNYTIFMISNTIGFVHSILLILLLLCGFSFKSKLLMRTLKIITWICVISMLITYGCSFLTLATKRNEFLPLNVGIDIFTLGWGLTIVVLIIVFLFKLVNRVLNKIGIVHCFCWTMLKVKKGLVWLFMFPWIKCSLIVQSKMTSAPKKDLDDESLP